MMKHREWNEQTEGRKEKSSEKAMWRSDRLKKPIINIFRSIGEDLCSWKRIRQYKKEHSEKKIEGWKFKIC